MLSLFSHSHNRYTGNQGSEAKKYAQRRASKGTTVYIPSPLKEENMYIPWKLLAFLSKDFILF